jgi:hypothetical protein
MIERPLNNSYRIKKKLIREYYGLPACQYGFYVQIKVFFRWKNIKLFYRKGMHSEEKSLEEAKELIKYLLELN